MKKKYIARDQEQLFKTLVESMRKVLKTSVKQEITIAKILDNVVVVDGPDQVVAAIEQLSKENLQTLTRRGGVYELSR